MNKKSKEKDFEAEIKKFLKNQASVSDFNNKYIEEKINNFIGEITNIRDDSNGINISEKEKENIINSYKDVINANYDWSGEEKQRLKEQDNEFIDENDDDNIDIEELDIKNSGNIFINKKKERAQESHSYSFNFGNDDDKSFFNGNYENDKKNKRKKVDENLLSLHKNKKNGIFFNNYNNCECVINKNEEIDMINQNIFKIKGDANICPNTNSIQSDSWLFTYNKLILEKHQMMEWIIFFKTLIEEQDLSEFLITHNGESTYMFLKLNITCRKYEKSNMDLYKYKNVTPRLDACKDYKFLLDYCNNKDHYYTNIKDVEEEIMNEEKFVYIEDNEDNEEYFINPAYESFEENNNNVINTDDNDESSENSFKRNYFWVCGPFIFDKQQILANIFKDNGYFKTFDDDWSNYKNQKYVYAKLPSNFDEEYNEYIDKWSNDETLVGVVNLEYDVFCVVCDYELSRYCEEHPILKEAWEKKFQIIRIDKIEDIEIIKNMFKD